MKINFRGQTVKYNLEHSLTDYIKTHNLTTPQELEYAEALFLAVVDALDDVDKGSPTSNPPLELPKTALCSPLSTSIAILNA
jgi:hypothetical protein